METGLTSPEDKTFSHRFNSDGTVDSICHRCFQTIAKSNREADLETVEQFHRCDPDADIRLKVRAEEAKLHER